MKRITSFILLCAAMLVANAQSRHVYGRVVDSDNDEPLIGVSVMPVGGGAGTVTDLDGNFYLGLDNTVSQIKVSYVGMQTETLEAHFGEEMLIKMKSLDYALDEVIVVAYGTSTKGAYTGSASVVNAAQLEDRLVTDVTKALSGTVAGVQIQSASGQPGTEPVVRIRGVGSINAGMDPLYVVDGIPFDGGMNSINPQDVESITVLKDAASAALYGARGANGVILVTTKKGREGRKITLDARWGVNSRQVPRYDVITSPSDYMLAVYNSRRNYYIYRGQSEEAAYGFAVNGNSKDPALMASRDRTHSATRCGPYPTDRASCCPTAHSIRRPHSVIATEQIISFLTTGRRSLIATVSGRSITCLCREAVLPAHT